VNDGGLAREVRRLVDRVTHWTPSRWAASGVSGTGSRADMVYALVQDLADHAADAEGEPHRPVPRLDNDAALPDQLRVIAADLLAVGSPDVLTAAAGRVATISRDLGHFGRP
jgi:hypothetical protein